MKLKEHPWYNFFYYANSIAMGWSVGGCAMQLVLTGNVKIVSLGYLLLNAVFCAIFNQPDKSKPDNEKILDWNFEDLK